MNRFIALLAAAMACSPPAAAAEETLAAAWLDPDHSAIIERGDGVDLLLALSAPVPYKITLLDGPPRLVLDFRSVDFERLYTGDLGDSEAILAVRHGEIEAGWSRMVIDLSGPYVVQAAEMRTGAADAAARLEISLRKTDPTTFATRAGRGREAVRPPAADDARLSVVIDPGHGGTDPGAIREGADEASLVLSFALELAEALRQKGGFEVTLTRSDDRFVPLEARRDAAHLAGGEVLLSLHADALADGAPGGAQVIALAGAGEVKESKEPDDQPGATPGSDALTEAMTGALREAGITLRDETSELAGLAAPAAPDTPSLLLELGFMSDPADVARLNDPAWRARVQAAIVAGLEHWHSQGRTGPAFARPQETIDAGQGQGRPPRLTE